MQKKAFSVMELLVASIIIGVVIVVGIQSAKRATESYDNYFYAAYNVLNKAVYNAYLQPTGGDDIFNDANSLCNALTGFINTTQDNCDSAKLTMDADDNLNFDNTPSFTAVNGMKFYLGDPFRYGGDYSYGYYGGMAPANIKPDFRASVIGVDLNGNKGPNTHIYDVQNNPNVLPDRVFFVALNAGNGSVIPIGLPDVDRRYFQVRVVLPEFQYDDSGNITTREVRLKPDVNEINSDNPMINKTPPMSLHDARIFAWGDKTATDYEGFYATQPMSYHPVLTNKNFAKNLSCDMPAALESCTNAIDGIYNTDGMKEILKIQEKQMYGYNYAANTNFKFKMTTESGKSEDVNVNHGAAYEYGCTPNNSECYIVPLRN